MHKWIIATLFAALTGCGFTSSDGEFETSRPAQSVAEGNPNVLAPDDFSIDSGLHRNAVRTLPGYPAYYCPESLITRAQAASYLARANWGRDFEHPTYDGDFTDVTANMVHARSIGRVTDEGIMKPCGDEAFCPDHVVTRSQMAAYVARARFGEAGPPSASSPFGDVASDPNRDAIEWAGSEGVPGCGTQVFCPADAVTRADMASFLALLVADRRTSSDIAFTDVDPTHPRASDIAAITRAGVTEGCMAPVLGYRVNGYPLTALQRSWLVYFAGRWMPSIESAAASDEHALEVGANAVWWGLKQNVFGRFEDPFGYSECYMADKRQHLEPFDSCPQDAVWQVGLNAAVLPQATGAEINAAVAALYPGTSAEEVAAEVVSVGRNASRLGGTWVYPEWAEDTVLNDPYLMRSWLARDPAVAAWVMADDISTACVSSWSADLCSAQGAIESNHFAGDAQVASDVRRDLRALLRQLRADAR